MRSLKSILMAAGSLKKRSSFDEKEEMLALKALIRLNIPKLTKNDTFLFMRIV